MKSYKKITALCMVLLTMGCSCFGGCGNNSKEVAESGGDSGGGSSVATDSDGLLDVTLSLDKQSYKEGEDPSFKLVISNNRMLWNIAEVSLSYTFEGGFEPAEGTELPDNVNAISYGDSMTVEGVIRNTGAAGTYDTKGKLMTKSITGEEKIVKRPYVKFDYNGTESMVRVVAEVVMRQQKAEISSADRIHPKITSCHDPSIFKDKDGTYYIFGTHIALSSSPDLLNWTNRDNEFRNSFTQETKDKIREYNDDGNVGNWFDYLWAPDVVYNEQLGKYCMYLSANGDFWVSNIVMLTADNVTGPYDYAGTVVYGGFTPDTMDKTDVEKVLGEATLPERYITNGVANRKWGDMYPNCIDPCVFYDDDGKLWMSYGSWSGGIFMLKLDNDTGLRDYSVQYETNIHSDAYFGKKIAGGAYVSGEASYIQKIGEYYYLFVTYGGLSAREGYNMRVFRSTVPDGDYVDELGNTPYYDTYEMNFNDSRGVRLFGAYKWRTFTTGQVAQGHNSAFVDDDGKAYLIYHTRTTKGTEEHFVRVHRLLVNEDGWLCASPYQTQPDVFDAVVPESALYGTYETMFHRLIIDYANYDVVTAEGMTLNEDHTVTGFYDGTWSYDENTGYLNVVIDGVTYKCVVLHEKIEDSAVDTIVFTGLGAENQITLWGSRSIEDAAGTE